MADRKELLGLVREKREAAARVQRIAQEISLHADREIVLMHAKELEAQAEQLERQVGESRPAAASLE